MNARARRYFIKLFTRMVNEPADAIYKKERSAFPEARVERIAIYGQPAFVDGVSAALTLLRNAFPYGYRLVQRYIPAIVQSGTDPSRGQANGVVYVAASSTGELRTPVGRFAAALVRRAAAARKLLGFQIWRSRRSALGSLNLELRAMRLLHCDPKHFHAQTNRILTFERQLGDKSRPSHKHLTKRWS